MYSMIAGPQVASTIARQRIEERIREPEARRTARAMRRAARTERRTWRPRKTWSVPAFRRAVTS
jgi:hypothetical protein